MIKHGLNTALFFSPDASPYLLIYCSCFIISSLEMPCFVQVNSVLFCRVLFCRDLSCLVSTHLLHLLSPFSLCFSALYHPISSLILSYNIIFRIRFFHTWSLPRHRCCDTVGVGHDKDKGRVSGHSARSSGG